MAAHIWRRRREQSPRRPSHRYAPRVTWWTENEWRDMLRGHDCPMCADMRLASNDHSDLIAPLTASVARLHRNQTKRGYVVVILNQHVCEFHDLDAKTRAEFWNDVSAVGRAVTTAFAPVKLDYLVMGHRCPHLHCHVYPQYPDDDPFAEVDISAGLTRLSLQEQAGRVEILRQLLVEHHT